MNTEIKKCLVCFEGILTEDTIIEKSHYKGIEYSVKCHISICPVCGSDFVLPKQAKLNSALAKDEIRKIDGLLTASEITDIRTQLGLTKVKASELFCRGKNSFSKYESSEVIQSASMDKFLRLVANRPNLLLNDLKILNGEKTDYHNSSSAIATSNTAATRPKLFKDSTTDQSKATYEQSSSTPIYLVG